jgi:hypothetical protein
MEIYIIVLFLIFNFLNFFNDILIGHCYVNFRVKSYEIITCIGHPIGQSNYPHSKVH